MDPVSQRPTGDRSRVPRAPIAWHVSDGLVDYEPALAAMRARAHAIADGTAPELVWLLQHPALYTAGTSARSADLLQPDRFPVHAVGRGGEYTYHGPGQWVGYVMLDIKARGGDVRAFVHQLEAWLIDALAVYGITAGVRTGRVGVWVERAPPAAPREAKIAALGLRVTRGVSTHGIALNVAPDLSHFSGIVPCGLSEYGVTSLADLGITPSMAAVADVLRAAFEARFGRTTPAQDAVAPPPTDRGAPHPDRTSDD